MSIFRIVVFGMLAGSASVLAMATDPDYEQGRRLFRQEQYAEAAASFEKCLERDPRNTRALLELGRAYSANQDWEPAIRSYERLIGLEPKNEKAWNNLGNVYFRTGRYEEATHYYEGALQRDPEYQTARFHYGYTLHQLNRPREAAVQFDRCLKIQPSGPREARTQADCGFYRGVLFYRDGNYANTVSTMQQVLRAMPLHPEAHYYLGMAFRQLGRVDEARVELEQHRTIKNSMRSEGTVRKAGSP